MCAVCMCSLVVCGNANDLHEMSNWDGKGPTSRCKLIHQLQGTCSVGALTRISDCQSFFPRKFGRRDKSRNAVQPGKGRGESGIFLVGEKSHFPFSWQLSIANFWPNFNFCCQDFHIPSCEFHMLCQLAVSYQFV